MLAIVLYTLNYLIQFYFKKMNFKIVFWSVFLLIKEFYKENYKQIFRSFEGKILVLIFRFQARSLETFPIDHGKANLEADVCSRGIDETRSLECCSSS